MPRFMFLALSLCILAGCGRSTTPALALTAAEAHTRWINALQADDRRAARDLIGDDVPVARLDDFMDQTQSYIAKGYRSVGFDYGAFQRIETLGEMEPVAQGERGHARITFAHGAICYDTTLAASDGAWKVVRWDQYNCRAR